MPASVIHARPTIAVAASSHWRRDARRHHRGGPVSSLDDRTARSSRSPTRSSSALAARLTSAGQGAGSPSLALSATARTAVATWAA